MYLRDNAFIDCTALKCFFLVEDEDPLPTKPSDMVLIIPLKGGLSS